MPTNNRTITTVADVVDAVNANLSNLTQGELYSLEQLVGEGVWNTIPTGRRNHLGIAFKAHARSVTLPVRYVLTTNSNKTMYELR